MAVMPEQKPGKSEQVVETPDDFIDAVKQRLSIQAFSWDLAASPENTKATGFYTEEDNSLLAPWFDTKATYIDWMWCNPPYSNLEPWVEKAWRESRMGAMIAMLVPASVGSAWWFEHVSQKAYITNLHPRLTFVGHKSPYPKDLALLLYAPFLCGGTTDWTWK